MQGKIQTVNEYISPDKVGLADAHGHVWIDRMPGQQLANPFVLDNYRAIKTELRTFHDASGRTIVDCQTAGVGRNGNRLAQLSSSSGVHIIAATGFYLRQYYPRDYWIWSASEDAAAEFFEREIRGACSETADTEPVRAGFIKIALTEEPGAQLQTLMRAAARASQSTGAALLFHTERGAWAEHLPQFFGDLGIETSRLIVCHIDKRPDFGLHADLARAGALLEYDTFLRPKYEPKKNLWPLLERMVAAGFDAQIACGLDAADAQLWAWGGGPGLASLPNRIVPRMYQLGFSAASVKRLTGENIARVLTNGAS